MNPELKFTFYILRSFDLCSEFYSKFLLFLMQSKKYSTYGLGGLGVFWRRRIKFNPSSSSEGRIENFRTDKFTILFQFLFYFLI